MPGPGIFQEPASLTAHFEEILRPADDVIVTESKNTRRCSGRSLIIELIRPTCQLTAAGGREGDKVLFAETVIFKSQSDGRQPTKLHHLGH